MGLYLRGNRYYFKKQIDGRAYYTALKLRRGQESLLTARIQQVEAEIVAQHFGLPSTLNKSIGFADYCHKYLEQKKHKKTFDRDQQRLLKIMQVWGNLSLSVITKTHIQQLEKWLFAANKKASTVNRYFELLSHLFNLAIEDGYAKENPCRFYQRFVEDYTRRALSRPELSKILKVSKQIQAHPKNNIQSMIYDLILVGLNTGMRLSEILFLKKEYLNKNILIYPITETKSKRRIDTRSNTKKVKFIYLNSISKKIISKFVLVKEFPPLISPPLVTRDTKKMDSGENKEVKPKTPLHPRDKTLQEVLPRDMGRLFVTSRDNDYIFPIKYRNPNCVFRTVRLIRKRSGVPDFSFHQLRHTVSTWVAAQSSLSTAKYILGHADIKTTLKYTHPEIEEQRKGVAKIEQEVLRLLPK